jgi:LPXTG-motif cell wall-anchored protein
MSPARLPTTGRSIGPILRVVAVQTLVGAGLVLIARRRPQTDDSGMTARSSDTR